MVFMSTNLYRVAFHAFTYPTYIVVQIVFDPFIDQVFSVFCAEYDMRVYFGK